MARSKKIDIQIRKDGKHFALIVEDQLVALTVYRKGATTVESLLRGCIKYSSRTLFRSALEEALTAPDQPESQEETTHVSDGTANAPTQTADAANPEQTVEPAPVAVVKGKGKKAKGKAASAEPAVAEPAPGEAAVDQNPPVA